MSLRAVIVGLVLGAGLCAFTYFNDFVIRQTMLVGNFFPFSVFGGLLLTLLLVNPLLGRRGRRWPLTAAELAVITGILLAACSWPGSNFGRYVGTLWTMPNHWQQTRPDWHAQHVMSYLPGGSAEIGQGHVQDWPALLDFIDAGGRVAIVQLQDSDYEAGFLPLPLSLSDDLTALAEINAPDHPIFADGAAEGLIDCISYDSITAADDGWTVLARDRRGNPSVVEASVGKGAVLVVQPSPERYVVGSESPSGALTVESCSQLLRNMVRWLQPR